jgi:hypothetical protein
MSRQAADFNPLPKRKPTAATSLGRIGNARPRLEIGHQTPTTVLVVVGENGAATQGVAKQRDCIAYNPIVLGKWACSLASAGGGHGAARDETSDLVKIQGLGSGQ